MNGGERPLFNLPADCQEPDELAGPIPQPLLFPAAAEFEPTEADR